MIRVPTAVSAINDKYNLSRSVGKGASSTIYNAIDKMGNEVAVKHIKKKIKEHITRAYKREKKIHPQLDHPNIIKLIEIIENEDNIYFVMEKCKMNLYELIKSLKPKLSEFTSFDEWIKATKSKHLELSTVKKYFKEIVEGVKYLHDKNIAHRDLKPENIVLCDDKVKIIDFGFAVYDTEKETKIIGTLDYLAPEMVLSGYKFDYFAPETVLSGYKGKPVDVWALGVLLYEMIYSIAPFYDQTHRGTYDNIIKGTPEYGEKKGEAINLIKKIFTLDPFERPTIDDILKDPFLL